MTTATALDQFYETLAVPDRCMLGKRLFKKQFYENAQLNVTDRKAFVEDIDSIEWRYTLKPSTINIPKFEDETREYLEIAILQVGLNATGRHGRIAGIMQKAIPYPVVIVFTEGDKIAINAADKRINRADANRIVVETTHDTGWIDLAAPEPWQAAFLDDFRVTNFSFRDFLAFYGDIVQRIVALNCAVHTGRYELVSGETASTTDRLQALKQIEQLQRDETETRNKLKKEKNMGTQVQLNTRVKEITDRIEAIKKAM